MQFVEELPEAHLCQSGSRHKSFVAELFGPRPRLDAMVSYRRVAAEIEQNTQKLVSRAVCPFAHVGIYVDHMGAWLLVKAKHELSVCNARSGLITVLAPLDAHETDAELTSRKSMEQTVRPFDELDKQRLDSWQTAAMVRPKFPAAPKPEAPASELPRTLQELAASLSDSEAEDEGPRMLSLTDAGLPCVESVEQPDVFSQDVTFYRECFEFARDTWYDSAKERAVVVLLSVGEPLRELTYIHCHREERRVELLITRLPVLSDMSECVSIAAILAMEGALPSPLGPRARKAEFLARCETALKRKNPLAQCDLKQLPTQDQRKIAVALGLKTQLCSRCPRPAETSVEFSLSWLDGVPEPHPDTRFFCCKCAPTHPATCLKCDKHDSLVHHGPVRSLVPFLNYHIFSGLRCKDCHTLAVAPLTTGEKRKRDQDLMTFERRARVW